MDGVYKQLDGAAEQVDNVIKAPQDYLVREVNVTEPGYAFIFLSNENLTQVDFHFDDVTITHTHSNIVAGAHYYPFGLTMETREITDEPYRYGYQGQFSEKDLTTGMQEFELRMYDPRIGRWLTPDPYGQYPSPYLSMGNAPYIATDPTGGFAGDCPSICPGMLLESRLSTEAVNAALADGYSLALRVAQMRGLQHFPQVMRSVKFQ